jgi:nicotinamide riboside kinase
MNQPVKLAIVGASSTGKTTIWNELREKYQSASHIAFVHESAREFFQQNKVAKHFVLDVQEKILQLALSNEQKTYDLHPKIILTDTSALEVIFYTKVSGDTEGANMLLEKVRPWIRTYTKFLLLNPEDVQFENDEIRLESKEVRDNIHTLMVDFYHKERLPFELISGTIPERKKRIGDIIKSYLTLIKK